MVHDSLGDDLYCVCVCVGGGYHLSTAGALTMWEDLGLGGCYWWE